MHIANAEITFSEAPRVKTIKLDEKATLTNLHILP